MLLTYTAPNRAHHYGYAAAFARAGVLHAFVSGFSRFSPRAAVAPEVAPKLIRADQVQNVFLASQHLRVPEAWSDELGHWSKIWLDWRSLRPARASQVFLFYSGAGLGTARRLQGAGVVRVVEAVNSHVLVQERILVEEHRKLGLPFKGFHAREVARRVEEYAVADAILCPSEFVRRSFLEQGHAPESIVKVPYGFDPGVSGPRGEKTDETFRVLYVGQISVRKALRYLFTAFAQLRHPKKELWIVGPPSKVTGIEDTPVPEGTRFLGVLKGAELKAAYAAATVFVLPSIEEGLGLVIGEALSFGLPVMATVNSGAIDLYSDGVEGFHLPIADSAAIAEKLQTLAEQPELVRTMSAAALKRCAALGGTAQSGAQLVAAMQGLAESFPR